jgi:hypothetical protein
MSSVNADVRGPPRTIARVDGYSDSVGHQRRNRIFFDLLREGASEKESSSFTQRQHSQTIVHFFETGITRWPAISNISAIW